MIIKPYSAIAEESFVAANFPSVKHFFPCNEAAGVNTLSDVVGNIVINYAGLTRTTDGFGADTTVTTGQSTSGTWSTPGSKLWVFFAVAKYSNIATSTLSLGASGDKDSIIMKGTTSSVANNTSGANCIGTAINAPANDVIGGRALAISAYNSATGLNTYQFSATTTGALLGSTATDATSSGGVAYTTGAGLDMGVGGFTLGGANSAIYGIVWFEFTSLPTNLLAGLAWMTAEFAAGRKSIYPAWKGLA